MNDLLYFLKYLKKGKIYLILGILCGIAYGALSGLGVPVLFEKVFKKLFEANRETQSMSYIILVGFMLPVIFLFRGVFSFLNGYLMSMASMIVMKELRFDIFKRMQFLPMSFFDRNSQGDLIARLSSDPAGVQNILVQVASEIIKQPFQLISASVALIYVCIEHQSYFMFPIFIITILLAALPIKIVKQKVRSKGRALQDLGGGVLQQISENLDAVAEVRSFNLQKVQIERHSYILDKIMWFGLKLAKYQRLQQPVAEFVSTAIISVIFLYGYMIQMPFSAFAAIGAALYFATDPLKRLSNLITDYHIVEGSMARIKYVLDMPLVIEDPVNPIPVDVLRGEVVFKDVQFSYDKSPILQDINVRIPAGTKVALVGHSGAGKSTFSKLISRFYDVNGGDIFIDSIRIKDMRLEDLRRNIAIVPQYPVLFNDTIFTNIQLGYDGSSAEEVYTAAKKAYAHDYITKFEKGYDTHVGDRGDLLSGGQKQRIALARAFLKNAPILILDEATSSLDSESEHSIQQALKELTKNKTVITIAHRLSTIKNSDMILVFENGKIANVGTHNELIKASPIYRNFVEKQNLHAQEDLNSLVA